MPNVDLTPVSLLVPGQPVPQERAGRNGRRSFTPAKTAEFRERVVTAWRVEGRPLLEDQPLEVGLLFVFEHSRSNLKKDGTPKLGAPSYPFPDVDNLAKGVFDALNGLLYDDDSQVVRVRELYKRFAWPGEEPHSVAVFTPLPCPDVGT